MGAAYLGGVVSTSRFLKVMWPQLDVTAIWPAAAAIYDALRKEAPNSLVSGYADLADLAAARPGKSVQHAFTTQALIRDAAAALDELKASDPIRGANLVVCKGRVSVHLYAIPRLLAPHLTDAELTADVYRLHVLPQTHH